MSRIKVNRVWLTEEKMRLVKVCIMLIKVCSQLRTVTNIGFESIDVAEAEELEVPFTEEEVFKVLQSYRGDKAPGPDGFPIAFWQFS